MKSKDLEPTDLDKAQEAMETELWTAALAGKAAVPTDIPEGKAVLEATRLRQAILAGKPTPPKP